MTYETYYKEAVDSIIREHIMKWIEEDGMDMGIGNLRRKYLVRDICYKIFELQRGCPDDDDK